MIGGGVFCAGPISLSFTPLGEPPHQAVLLTNSQILSVPLHFSRLSARNLHYPSPKFLAGRSSGDLRNVGALIASVVLAPLGRAASRRRAGDARRCVPCGSPVGRRRQG